ncbi:hypothetical protein TruAng_000707 [Truncatella angustata]|nr:hypothetical protein TruAng_000707 [Truncatella angustata]
MKSLTWTCLLLSPSTVLGRPTVDSDNVVQGSDNYVPEEKRDANLFVEHEHESAAATATTTLSRRASHIDIEVVQDEIEDSKDEFLTRRDQASYGTSYCCIM